VALALSGWAVACGSSSSTTNTTQRVTPGGECLVAGAVVDDVDGCNTCTCTDGKWACTNMACVDGGEPGGGGPGGSVGTGGEGAGGSIGIAGSRGGSAGAIGGGPATCVNGTTSGDGCNSCTCVNGSWACTDRYCPPSLDAGSAPRPCGARAGDTCTAGEYCAYQAGQYCGAADAQAVCLPRPIACTTQYNPVCGCDGNTHSNACEAAAAGTGVRTTGACTALPF
jgi:hypothetical protein